jgi:FlaG/FlaF family flagellin (archaellin)
MSNRIDAQERGGRGARKQPLRDRAVSPAIGVALIIVITLLISATLGVFAFTQPDQSSDAPVDAEFKYSEGNNANTVTITYDGDDPIEGDRLVVRVNGRNASSQFPDVIGPGTRIVVEASPSRRIEITYVGENGDTTIISSREGV